MTTAAAIFIFGLLVIAVGLMGVAYGFKAFAYSFGAVMMWVLLGVYSYGLSAAPWDIFYGLFWFSMAMVVVSALEALALGLRTREAPDDEPEPTRLEIHISKMESHAAMINRWKRAMGVDTEEQREERRQLRTGRRQRSSKATGGIDTKL